LLLLRGWPELGLSPGSDAIVREVANGLASNRDGLFVPEYALSMPNDQVTTYHLIQVIRSRHR